MKSIYSTHWRKRLHTLSTLAIPLLASLVLLPFTGCSTSCREVCEHQSTCFGDKAGDPDLCTAACEAQNYESKQSDLDCVAQASCDELAASSCTPSCTDLCQKMAECQTTAEDCTDRCSALSVNERECLHRLSCQQAQSGCTASSQLKPDA